MSQHALKLRSRQQATFRHVTESIPAPHTFPAIEPYTHPFELVPAVDEPAFDTTFAPESAQHALRMEALLNLVVLTINEQGGPSEITDNWLEILRQNVRETSGKSLEISWERSSLMGQVAMYLATDTSLRESPEADVYKTRVERAELDADNSYISGSPYRNAHLAIKKSLGTLHGTPLEVAQNVTPNLPTDPETPEFTIAKAKALFDYASTVAPGTQKTQLLFEAMTYATESIARADVGDSTLRGSALHILSRSIHDASFMTLAFSWNEQVNDRRATQARKLAIDLLENAKQEFHVAHINHASTPADTSRQWQVPGYDKSEEYTRYFSGIYPNDVPATETAPGNPEIKRIIVTETAQKFGHEIVSFAAMKLEPETNEPEPTEKRYTAAS